MSERIDGPVVGDPVPATLPLECRRGIRVFQGQRGPRCVGILKADLGAIRRMLERGDLATVGCPKCQLKHGFCLVMGEIYYGTIL